MNTHRNRQEWEPIANKKRIHQLRLRTRQRHPGSLVTQANDPKSPFTIKDWSLDEPFDEKWKVKVRDIIHRVDLTIVLCGEFTDKAAGVSAEMTIIREENRPYFLLRGRKRKPCKKPNGGLKSDVIHPWNWKTLQKLIDGAGYRK